MILRLLGALSALLWASLATAQDFPARYSVQDVTANDVLNIRTNPSAASTIIGHYGPYAVNIEILALSPDGKWGKVGRGEGNGWVSMRYVNRDPITDPYRIPRPMTCLGTEPFWSFNLALRGTDFAEAGAPLSLLNELEESVTSSAFLGRYQEGPTLTHTVLIERALCSDGMSDRAFGFSARVFINAPDGNRFLTGCCTMEQNR